jgi:hypothetical protein
MSNKLRYKIQNPQITDALLGNTSQYLSEHLTYTKHVSDPALNMIPWMNRVIKHTCITEITPSS